MNIGLILDLVLGFGMSFFTAQGETQKADILRKLASMKAAGQDIDAHMERVAAALTAGTPLDWDQLQRDIDVEVDEFLSRGSGGEAE